MAINTTKFVRRVRLRAAFILEPQIAFEIQNASIGFEARTNEFTLIDGTFKREVIWYRFVCSFSTPWLRRADNAATGLIQAINLQDFGGTPFEINFPDIDSSVWIPVLPVNTNYNSQVNRQILKPNQDWQFRAVNTVTEIPSWFAQERSKSQYI